MMVEAQPPALGGCLDGSTAEELEVYDVAAWWLEGFAQIMVNGVGISTNMVAIPVLLSKELDNIFNRTLALLAIVDTIFNVCDIMESVRMYHGASGLHRRLFPHLLYPLQNVAMVASIYITIVVAAERYFAVTRPISAYVEDTHRGWKRVAAFVVPVLVFAILFNIPTFFEFHLEPPTGLSSDSNFSDFSNQSNSAPTDEDTTGKR